MSYMMYEDLIPCFCVVGYPAQILFLNIFLNISHLFWASSFLPFSLQTFVVDKCFHFHAICRSPVEKKKIFTVWLLVDTDIS